MKAQLDESVNHGCHHEKTEGYVVLDELISPP